MLTAPSSTSYGGHAIDRGTRAAAAGGRGPARLSLSRGEDARTVVVGDRRLVGRHVVLATGSFARTLPGLEIGGRVMTSDEALGLDEVPGRVVVLGGGVIGVEFASVLRSFGSEVTVVEALPRLVAAEEPARARKPASCTRRPA